MKLNNKGWGYRMMTVMICILLFFLLIAIYYIYKYYDSMKTGINENIPRTGYIR